MQVKNALNWKIFVFLLCDINQQYQRVLDTRSNTSYSIPIVVPPGTGGLEPAIAIVYDSRGRGGNAGYGWSLGLPKIARSPHYGVDKMQSWQPAEAVWLYRGEELERSSDRVEDLFACSAVLYYRHVHSGERILFCEKDDYWTITETDGTVFVFGRTTQRHSKLRFPQEEIPHTFEYYLEEVRNTNGLSWTATYTPLSIMIDGCCGTFPPRLSELKYTFHTSPDRPAEEPNLLGLPRRIIVDWEDRADPEFAFQYGIHVIDDKRLRNIRVLVGDEQVRRYHFEYKTVDPYGLGLMETLLSSVTEYGVDDVTSMPPITFKYHSEDVGPVDMRFSPSEESISVSSLDRSTHTADETHSASVIKDLDGDGATGVTASTNISPPTSSDRQSPYMQRLIDEDDKVKLTAFDFIDMDGDRYLDALFIDDNDGQLHVGLRRSLEFHTSASYEWMEWPSARGRSLDNYSTVEGTIETKVYGPTVDANVNATTPVISVADDAPIDAVFYRPSEPCPDMAPVEGCIPNWGDDAWTFEIEGEVTLTWDKVTSSITLPIEISQIDGIVDMTGDGCADRLIIVNGGWEIRRNMMCDPAAVPGFANSTQWSIGGSPFNKIPYFDRVEKIGWGNFSYTHRVMTRLIDLNGDGLTDLFHHNDNLGTTSVFIGTGSGFLPEIPGTPTTYARDLIEILGPSTSITEWANPTTPSHPLDPDQANPFFNSSSIQTLGLFDVNGDERLDLIQTTARIASGTNMPGWDVYFNTGSGFQSEGVRFLVDQELHDLLPNVSLAISPLIQHLLPIQATRVEFESPIPIESETSGVWRLFDHTGSGTPSLLVRTDRYEVSVYENPLSRVSHLLSEIDNGRGLVTKLHYEPINIPGLGGSIDVLQEVQRINVSASPDNSYVWTTAYEYADPFYDRENRTFRGFARVISSTTDEIGTEERLEERRFLVGKPGRSVRDYYAGRTIADGLGLAGKLYLRREGPKGSDIASEVWTEWIASGVDPRYEKVVMPRVTTLWNVNIAGDQRRWREIEYDYDGFGNIIRRTNFGEVVRGHDGTIDRDFGNDQITEVTDFALNGSDHAVDRPARWRICVDIACSEILHTQEYYYDGSTILETIDRGNLTKIVDTAYYDDAPLDPAVRDISYDDFGNVVTLSDEGGPEIKTFYWGPEFAYPQSQSARIQQGKEPSEYVDFTHRYWWDARFGSVAAAIDSNGRQMSYMRDVFGRLREMRSSPPSAAVTSVQSPSNLILLGDYQYSTGPDLGENFVVQRRYDQIGSFIEARTYFDGAGQPLQEKRLYAIDTICAAAVCNPSFREALERARKTGEAHVDLCDQIGWECGPSSSGERGTSGTSRGSGQPSELIDRPGICDDCQSEKRISTTSRSYDYFGNVVRQTVPYSTSTWDYTALDLNEFPPSSPTWRSTFDWAGREIRRALEYSEDGLFREYYELERTYELWDELRVEAHHFAQAGRRLQYDANGGLKSVQEILRPASVMSETRYTYDRLGNLTSCENPNGHVTVMRYDSRGALRYLADPNTSNCGSPPDCAHQWEYDQLGRLSETTDAKGQTVRYHRDELGRAYWKQYCPNDGCGERDVFYRYDEERASIGLLSSVVVDSDSAGSTQNIATTYKYDFWGRVVSETKKIGNDQYHTGTQYDHLGRVRYLTYPTGEAVSYSYGVADQIESIQIAAPGDPPAVTSIVQEASYDASFRPVRIRWGNGSSTQYEYGNGSQRIQRRNLLGRYSRSWEYDYHKNGNSMSIDDHQVGAATFQYDYANRLKRIYYRDQNDTYRGYEQYNYDLSGNILSSYGEGPYRNNEDLTYIYSSDGAGPNAATRVLGASNIDLTYDKNGSVLSLSDGTTFSYNYDGRLNEVHGRGFVSATGYSRHHTS